MNVLFVSSESYKKYTYVTIMSLLRYNSEVNIYIIEDGFSENDKIAFQELIEFKFKQSLTFICGTNFVKSNKNLANYKGSVLNYVLLYLDTFEELSNLDKILCLESDLLIRGQLNEMYETELNDNYLAGVYQTWPNGDLFVYGGVYIINLNMFRKNCISSMVSKFYIDKKQLNYTQEVFISKFLMPKTVELELKYNAISEMMLRSKERSNLFYPNCRDDKSFKEAINNPTIVHFTSFLFGRPWQKNCKNPFRDEYLYYYKNNPFSQELEKSVSEISFIKLKYIIVQYFPIKLLKLIFRRKL